MDDNERSTVCDPARMWVQVHAMVNVVCVCARIWAQWHTTVGGLAHNTVLCRRQLARGHGTQATNNVSNGPLAIRARGAAVEPRLCGFELGREA